MAKLEFPTQTYTQSEPWTGKSRTYTTRSQFVGAHKWNEADIVYYEKLLAFELKVKVVLADAVNASTLIEEVESEEIAAVEEEMF